MANFLKRHYLDDAKLAQRALLEFHRALASGRLIAFTGSLTTQACGYGSWSEMVDAYGRLAGAVAASQTSKKPWEIVRKELQAIKANSASRLLHGNAKRPTRCPDSRIGEFRRFLGDEANRGFDKRVGLGLFEEALIPPDAPPMNMALQCGAWELDRARRPVDFLSIAIAKYFRKPHRGAIDDPMQDVLGALINTLGVRRVATLNYDFELERRLMLPDAEPGETAFSALRRLRASATGEIFEWQLSSGRIRRVMASGQAVESDILNRERIDRMLEFAIGTDDVDHHVLHLHGRACSSESMILSYRDYDKLYRRRGLSKLPFEFAQRIMMGGNPIVFVGMGLSEGELNEALEDFVSSSPYQRAAPTFLLWNVEKSDLGRAQGASRMEMLRLDWLHRLGVLTIFDTDLPPRHLDSRPEPRPARLAHLIKALPDHAARIAKRENYTGSETWRHMRKASNSSGPIYVWEVAEASRTTSDAWTERADNAIEALTGRLLITDAPVVGVVAKQGCGKGSLAWRLAADAQKIGVKPENTMLINGSFSFDTDSLLDAVARFINSRVEGEYLTDAAPFKPLMSRGLFFRSLARRQTQSLLLILNGSERFFSVSGDMLSAELDELLSLAASKKLPFLKIVVFGTARARGYIRDRLEMPVIDAADIGLEASFSEETLPVCRLDTIQKGFEKVTEGSVKGLAPSRSRHFEQAGKHVQAASAARISGDMPDLRRSFFDLYLDPAVLGAAIGQLRLPLAMEVLRALAFIGLPAEIVVLRHVERIRRRLKQDEGSLEELLVELERLGLVVRLVGYSGLEDDLQASGRYTLPRMLLTELRARFSVPLSEAKLSTAFNMSLYVAQPVDGYIPEPDIHDELGAMIDHLLGAYRDMASEDDSSIDPSWRSALEGSARELMPHAFRATADFRTPHGRKGHVVVDEAQHLEAKAREIKALAGAANVQCLRSALALIRGYYTTTDLLTLDIGDRLIREDRDGILLEHAERLDALIDAYGKVAMARDLLRRADGDRFEDSFGAVEPLYPDELVWLHNERGVIRLAIGDLYEARASFLRALEINRLHVERDDRSHNWRRIRLNQLTLDLEGGDISLATRKIEEILSISPLAGEKVSREDRLAAAVATGYRGWAHDLRGDKVGAYGDYDAAIKALAELGEIRAEVYFRRLRITLLYRDERIAESHRELGAATDLALATRQMDLLYRLRVLDASNTLAREGTTLDDRKSARRQLDEAHKYALQTDVNRVRVEAGMGMAGARLQSGDHEGALAAVADAMMVATRFGMELRKIVLRSYMALVMAERGHPITAKNLASTAIRIGSRLRYYQAIRHAEQTMAHIPPVSAITDVLDASDRREG